MRTLETLFQVLQDERRKGQGLGADAGHALQQQGGEKLPQELKLIFLDRSGVPDLVPLPPWIKTFSMTIPKFTSHSTPWRR